MKSTEVKEHGPVPSLRFPEFRDAGPWGVKRLGAGIDLISGQHLGPSEYTTKPSEFPYFTGPSDFTDDRREVTKWVAEDVSPKLAKKHDVLITVKGSGVGELWRLSLPTVAMGRQLMAVRGREFDSGFISHFLDERRANLAAMAAGNMIPGLARDDLLSIPIPVPPTLKEQQKIANCLSSLDDLIRAEGERVAALKVHKRGLMQRLFPAPGETTPRLRFPEFRDAGLWEVKRLRKLLSQPPDYGVNAPAVPYSDYLPAYLRITDINGDGTLSAEGRVSVDFAAAENRYLSSGDIVLARTGASVGKSYRYDPSGGELVFAGYLIRVRPDPRQLASTFLSHFLTTTQYWEWVEQTSARSGQPGINATEYAEMPVPLPPKFKEQQTIADCLTALNDLIRAGGERIEVLKVHKRGLIQRLFPQEAN